MANITPIEQAIDDLISQKTLNIRSTAKKYGLVESILRRHFESKTVSCSEAQSRLNMLLTNAQEQVLVEYLNKLSARGMHPTPQMLENLVIEIVKRPLGECWIRRFCQRHDDVIQSVYLRNINNSRHITDNSRHFQHYFDCVSIQSGKIHIFLL